MSNILRFHLIRHVPVLNPHGVWYGRDVEFDTTSVYVAAYFNQLAATLPHDLGTSLWVTSPYPRAEQTAQGVMDCLPHQEAPPLHINVDFVEQQYGVMEGRRHKDIKDDPRVVPYLQDMWGTPPEGGESMKMLQSRIGGALNDYAVQLPAQIKDVVIFAHGGVIMAAFAHATGQRMIDVFHDKKAAKTPSFSYVSTLELVYDRSQGTWQHDFDYQTGIRKPV